MSEEGEIREYVNYSRVKVFGIGTTVQATESQALLTAVCRIIWAQELMNAC